MKDWYIRDGWLHTPWDVIRAEYIEGIGITNEDDGCRLEVVASGHTYVLYSGDASACERRFRSLVASL